MHLEALAKLARITLAIPPLFAPVPVHYNADGANAFSGDGLLSRWGLLNRDVWLLDGTLAEPPLLTGAIAQAFSRTASVEVERLFFYVETGQSFLRDLARSFAGVTFWEHSTRPDAKELRAAAERNERVARYNALRTRVQNALNELPESQLRALYGIAGRDVPQVVVPERFIEPLRSLYRERRMSSITDRLVRSVSRNNYFIDRQRRETFGLLTAGLRHILYDTAVLERFDVPFRLRRLFYVLEVIVRELPHAAPRLREAYEHLFHALTRQLELLQIVDGFLDAGAMQAATSIITNRLEIVADIWYALQSALADLFSLEDCAAVLPAVLAEELQHHETEWLPKAQLVAVQQHFSRKLQHLQIAGTTVGDTVLRRTDAYELALFAWLLPRTEYGSDNPVRVAYWNFVVIDAYLFPLEIVAEPGLTDTAQIVRISPLDAQLGFSRRDLRDKIVGFPGVLSGALRANDVLWGRLDGCAQLLEILLAREHLRRVGDDLGCAHAYTLVCRRFRGPPSLGIPQSVRTSSSVPDCKHSTRTMCRSAVAPSPITMPYWNCSWKQRS